MAIDKKKTDPVTDCMEQYVEYTAPFGATPDEKPIIVSVNGETLRIRRGETVQIKRKFYEVLRQAAEQERAAYRYQQEAQRAADQAIARM